MANSQAVRLRHALLFAAGITGILTWGAVGSAGALQAPVIASQANGTGSTAVSGTVASSGSTGVTGPSGDVTESGSSGASGALGSSGASGLTGTTGNASITGQSGVTGTVGASGNTGTLPVVAGAHPLRAAGSTGSSGSTGMTGVTGFSGASGSCFSSGSTGSTGSTGATGTSGSPRVICTSQLNHTTASPSASQPELSSLATTGSPVPGEIAVGVSLCALGGYVMWRRLRTSH